MILRSLRRPVRVTLSLAVLLLLARGADAQDVLNDKSYWRVYVTWRTPTLVDAKGRQKPLYDAKTGKPLPVAQSPPPPAKWMATEFDDTGWAKARGPFHLGPGYRDTLQTVGGRAELHGVYLRGKFRVKDPSRVMMMKVMLRYTGGAVVYVNGKELQRGHLPEGKLGPDVLAEPYPLRHYLRPDGKLLHELSDRKMDHVSHKEWEGRFRGRVREIPPNGWLTAVAVPNKLLRKGVNVLAVANFAAPVSEVRLTGTFAKLNFRGAPAPWPHAGIYEARLHVAPGPAIVPNIQRPEGVQFWNRRIARRVFGSDYGGGCEPVRPIRLVACRNGSVSGQVVVGTTELIEELRGAVGALDGPEEATIPADRVQVRFARPDGPEFRGGLGASFDGLSNRPPKQLEPPPNQALNQPIWVTVNVPRDAAPGTYTGTLHIEADTGMEPVAVPVHLEVIDWEMPDPKAFATHLELVQSPETLAEQYEVELWSDKHWKLIDESFRLIGLVGAKTVHIPVIRRTYYGNQHSRVRWIRKDDGFDHDFHLVEKYLDTAIKHLGKIPVVCIYCRDHNTGAYYFGKTERQKPKGMPYSELDPKTGDLYERIGPKWGEPECRAFWKPVMEGLRDILKKRGLEQAFMVGISGDKMPAQACVDDLRAVAPEAPWVIASHANRTTLHGQRTGYVTDVWSSAGLIDSPEKRRRKKAFGWNHPRIRVPFPRAGGHRFVGPSLRVHTDLGAYRRGPEGAILSGARGYGRCGADFWPVFKKDWRYRGFLARYPESGGWHGGHLFNSYPYILMPGRDGPIASARLEALREGVQVNEARIFIEKTLTDPAKHARLGEDLVRRCWELLDARHYRVLRSRSASNLGRAYYLVGTETQMEALYTAAAEVAAALEK
jgi:hypothetical protein